MLSLMYITRYQSKLSTYNNEIHISVSTIVSSAKYRKGLNITRALYVCIFEIPTNARKSAVTELRYNSMNVNHRVDLFTISLNVILAVLIV